MPHSVSSPSPLNSLIIAALISFLYPTSLYLWPNALTSDRQHPKTIRRNFVSVLVASLISAQVLILYQEWPDPHYSPGNSFLGYINWKNYDSHWHFLRSCLVLPMLHVFVLFAVPMYIDLQSFYRTFVYNMPWYSASFVMNAIGHMLKQLFELPVIRNLLVAPLTEEFVFRGIILCILTPSFSNVGAVFISSILFGLMHTHHFVRNAFLAGKVNKRDLLACFVQCTYTALFGAYASIVYLSSGHLITPIVLHSFCNLNGLPNFEQIVANKCHLYLTFLTFSSWLYFLVSILQSL